MSSSTIWRKSFLGYCAFTGSFGACFALDLFARPFLEAKADEINKNRLRKLANLPIERQPVLLTVIECLGYGLVITGVSVSGAATGVLLPPLIVAAKAYSFVSPSPAGADAEVVAAANGANP